MKPPNGIHQGIGGEEKSEDEQVLLSPSATDGLQVDHLPCLDPEGLLLLLVFKVGLGDVFVLVVEPHGGRRALWGSECK